MEAASGGQYAVNMSVSDDHHQELLSAARAGDEDAFAALVLATQGELRRFLAARSYSVDLVEAALQDAYIRIHSLLDEYDAGRPVLPWLRGIAFNCLREELRRRARHQRRFVSAGSRLDQVLAEEAYGHAPAEHDAWAERLDHRLHHCLERLPAQSRRLIREYYLEDRPLTLLAQRFRRKASALASLLQRIRAALRECLAQGGAG